MRLEFSSAGYEPIDFPGPDGARHTIPHPAKWLPEQLIALEELGAAMDSDSSALLEIRDRFAGMAETDGGAEAVRDLGVGDIWELFGAFAELVTEWTEAEDEAGGSGKGPSASSARNRAERRSKPTRRSGASASGKSRSTPSKGSSGRS